MRYKLSIIVPVYNVEKYLDDCIQSILNQTMKEFELILINDGSSDNSGIICDKYAQRDNRVKVFHKENSGPGASRNLGIKVSSGEYIGFVDSDDTIYKDMYEKMYSTGVDYSAQIVACGYRETNEFTGEIKKFINPSGKSEYLENNQIKEAFETFIKENRILLYPSMWNKIYKSSYIKSKSLFINETINIAEDLCFNINAILNSSKIAAVKEDLYNYRRINSNSLMNKKDDKFYMNLEARKEILNTLKQNKINENIYIMYLRYENHKTISEYLGKFMICIKSENRLLDKYRSIKKLLNESYFIEAIEDYEQSYFVLKARIIIKFIKFIMYINKIIDRKDKVKNSF